jgi:hypothetical protein
MLKSTKPDIVYVNNHIINIITSMNVDQPKINIYGGLSSTGKGKGRGIRG